MLRSITLLFLLLFTLTVSAQLSTREKLKDFRFLFRELKTTYPYFEINKRMNKVDWLANRKSYERRIRSTSSDKEYLAAIAAIVGELNNGHTDFYPTRIHAYFYDAYREYAVEQPEIAVFVEELEKYNAPERADYWTALFEELDADRAAATAERQAQQEAEEEDQPRTKVRPAPENVHISLDRTGSTAVVSIRSFSYELTERDRPRLDSFFAAAGGYDHLVIDIQGNGGGDSGYWQQLIIPHLIDKSTDLPFLFAFRPSKRLKKFKPDYKANLRLGDIELPNLPPEFRTGEYRFFRTASTIEPAGDEAFGGKVYLLVDEGVYSSAETLAYFFKATGIGPVVGRQTAGDGVGTDPILLTLPASGLVMRFTGELGLNPDGSANEETRTVPDIPLGADSPSGRLLELRRMLLR